MKWISDVVFAILAAHVWGSLMLISWQHTAYKLGEKGYTRLLFYLLRAVVVAYLLPLGLAVVLIINEILVLDGRFMQITPVISVIGLWLFVIWLLGLCASFESFQESWQTTKHWLSDALPASKERQERFQEICKQTKIRPGRVLLYEKAGLKCGGITTGMFHPRIVLPEGEMDEYVERVTIIHELVHCSHGDVWFLTAARIVEVIHWFNPWIRGLAAQMSQWNEYACDWKVYNKYLGDMRGYSEVLLYTSVKQQEHVSGLYSSIGTEPMKLTRRMEKMIKMKKAMERPKIFGILAAVAVSLTSAGSALASTGIMAGGYRVLYELTDVEENEIDVQVLGDAVALASGTTLQDNSNINPEDYVNTGIEFIDVLPTDGYAADSDEDGIALAVSGNINWDLPTDFMRTTRDFWGISSRHIALSGVITPAGKILRVGIIEPDGIRRCIYATGSFSYPFPLDKTGTYCVYAINDNDEVVNLTGAYITY